MTDLSYQQKRQMVLASKDLLGTMTDNELGRQIGVPGRFVRNMRHRLGIKAYCAGKFANYGRRKNYGLCQRCGHEESLVRFRGEDICGACLNANQEPARLSPWSGTTMISRAQEGGFQF